MLILHLSDIHFRAPQCLRPQTDPDRTFRSLMLRDLRERVAELGPVGAILIGGDIAFKADPLEYGAAMEWITQLLDVSGCHLERLYVIPGNHDVDRGTVLRTPAVRNAHAAIQNAVAHRRESVLREQFEDAETGGTLLKPLAAYNEFAKVFSCQIYSPDHLYWKQDLPLGGGVRLRLNGLTTTVLSGAEGRDDVRMGLYLSPLQTGLDPEDDVFNLVIAHHPPDWCMDFDEIEEDLNDRAVVHLFGHKHRQRVLVADRYMRIGAAAVNPDRYETGFEPGYNLINVAVAGTGANRALSIEAHLRHLQRNPEQYRSRLNGDDPVYRLEIPIPDRNAISAAVGISQTTLSASVKEEKLSAAALAVIDPEAAMSDEATRNLVFRFWQLSISERRDIALALGLIDAEEMRLPEPERYGRALLRAGERGLIHELAEKVAKKERK